MTHYAPVATRTTRAAELSGWKRIRVLFIGATIRRQINKRTPADIGLSFETLHFPGTDGLRLEAWRISSRPSSPTVLMFPGYGGSKDTLLAAAQEFATMGWNVWMVDPHGIGGSAGTTTSLGWHEASDVAAAFRNFRSTQSGPCVLYGPSMGAVAILRAIHEGWVDPDAVILECPFDRFTNAIGTGYERMGLPRFPFGPAAAFWVGAQQGFNPFAHNPATYMRSVKCPTLLFQGELDDTVGRAYVREVGKNLRHGGTFALLPGAGHAFLVTRSADAWKKGVHDFTAKAFPFPKE